MEHLFYLGSLIAVWVIVALAANLVVGFTGMMAMGQAAYLGVGAYVAAALNILLGVHFYFALATLGVNFVFFDIFHNLAPRVEGSEGLYGLQLPGLFASPGPRFWTTL